MTPTKYQVITDDSIDTLVVAIQALTQGDAPEDFNLPAIDKGREIVRKWLAQQSK